MSRPVPSRSSLAGWVLLTLPLILAACSSAPSGSGSGSSSSSANASLRNAGAKVIANMSTYASRANACKSAPSPVVCLEHADVMLGNEIHDYANMLAVGKGFTAPQSDIVTARNSAQTLANSLEILGDAQPTQSNYDQVLNTFNLPAAITQLRADVQKLDRALDG